MVTIGGGTGAPIVIQALNQIGIKNIQAIAVSMDSGGKTGYLRSDERDRIIAISDLLRNLISLINFKDNHRQSVAAFSELIGYTDGRNRNLGYTIYYALLEKYNNNFLAVQKHLENMLGIQFNGVAIPVTLEPTHINFSTQNGQTFSGEHELDRLSMSKNIITEFCLDSQVQATAESLKAISVATHIIYCPGSIYGSILANFLPDGVTSVLKKSHARKILITNLVSDRNQTHKFTLLDYLHIFQKYTRLKKPFDYVLSPDLNFSQFNSKYPRVAKNYEQEHSYFLGFSNHLPLEFAKEKIQVFFEPIFSITPALLRIRHDPVKLGKAINKILQSIPK